MNRTLMITSLLLFSVSWACGPYSTVTVPNGYVALDDDSLQYDVAQKLVSADGAVVVIRERDNDPYGNLDFWTEALESEIQEGRGYDHLATEEIDSRSGRGRLLKFKSAYQGEPFLYNVALFTTESLIVTVETAVSEANAERHTSTFLETISTLTIDP